MKRRNEKAIVANWVVYLASIFAFITSIALVVFAGLGKTGTVLSLTVMYVSACIISKAEANIEFLLKKLERS